MLKNWFRAIRRLVSPVSRDEITLWRNALATMRSDARTGRTRHRASDSARPDIAIFFEDGGGARVRQHWEPGSLEYDHDTVEFRLSSDDVVALIELGSILETAAARDPGLAEYAEELDEVQ